MSTTSPWGSSSDPPASFVTSPGSAPDQGTPPPAVDADLVQETKNQIRALVHEIAQLAQRDMDAATFYDEFMRRVVTAMASVASAVWVVEDGQCQLVHQINLASTDLAGDEAAEARHARLLRQVAASSGSAVFPPHVGTAQGDAGGNPTGLLLIVDQFAIDERRKGLIEIFQRPGAGPATIRGYQRFVSQMCELAATFFKNRRLRQYEDREALWHDLEQFLREVHRSLDLRGTAYSVVNDGRRLIRCDRVSFASYDASRARVLAVSGVESVDRKSLEISRLEALISKVALTGQPFWFAPGDERPAPQIEEPLHAYLDVAHSTSLGILPLYAPHDESESGSSPLNTSSEHPDAKRRQPGGRSASILGVLVLEQLGGGSFNAGMTERARVVVEHSAAAVANAVAHSQLFLMPLWRVLGKAYHTLRRRLPVTLVVVALLVATTLALWLIPADFRLAAPGKLRPTERHDLFAQVDGAVSEVFVKHAANVRRGQPLLVLRSTDLDVALAELEGQRNRTLEQIGTKQQLLLKNTRLEPVVQDQLAGELQELRQALEGIEQRLQLLHEKKRQLVVTSPMDGQVVTWQIEDLLLRRPVNRGQALLSVVNPDGPWELELHLPERYVAHVLEAERKAASPLPVTFQLTSLPGQEFTGNVVEIQRVAEVREDAGNSIAVRVAIDKSQLPQLHNEATVQGQIHCGQRPLGYVWFHDVMETVMTTWLYWF